MTSICFYFQVHQPWRVRQYSMFDLGQGDYFSDASETDLNNRRIMEKVARKCYLPANAVLLELLEKHPEFKASFSLSGVAMEQFERFAPEVLESFRRLAATGRVEILSETYHHSLAFLYSRKEFERQVALHRMKVEDIFGVTPRVFRNTELIYSNEIANAARDMGYKAVLAEGADRVLDWRSANYLYEPPGGGIKLLLKNYKLSDDIAFRFGERGWAEYPLTAEKFAHWVGGHNGSADVINLFMDYETFGEHQWEDTGIFEFLRRMPEEVYRHPDNDFVTPSEAADRYPARAELDVPDYVSWADVERDLSAWRSNEMQHDALRAVYELESDVLETEDDTIIRDWRLLQTSDHFYYMCTKWFNDGDVHKYFNPYETPYDAFISYMNVLNDLKLRVKNTYRSQGNPVPLRKVKTAL